MTTASLSVGPRVRRITLNAAGHTLSALLSAPDTPPRATVVALHGAGMSAGYFDGGAQPDAGHNISLGRTARAYHLRALAFFEECLPERDGP